MSANSTPVPPVTPVPMTAPAASTSQPSRKQKANKGGGKQQGKSSSVFATKSMASCSKLLTVESESMKTTYFLDFRAILSALQAFSQLIRDQHRRPHPTRLSYESMFMKCFAAKIQHVGITTFQIRESQDLKIETTGITLPSAMSHYIAQFGIATTADGVEVFPFVTHQLVEYLNHFANMLMQHTQAGQIANMLAISNHKYFYARAYGELAQRFICLLELKTLLNIEYIATAPYTDDGVRSMSVGILQAHLYSQNPPTCIRVNDYQPFATTSVLTDPFIFGNALPAPGNGITQRWIQALAQVRGDYQHVVDWVVQGVAPAQLITMQSAMMVEKGLLRGDLAYLKKTFTCTEPVINESGTLAPLIKVDTVSRYATASTAIGNVPERDLVCALCLIGCNRQIWKDYYGTIFNVSTAAQARLRYSTSKMADSFDTLQMATFDDCLK